MGKKVPPKAGKLAFKGPTSIELTSQRRSPQFRFATQSKDPEHDTASSSPSSRRSSQAVKDCEEDRLACPVGERLPHLPPSEQDLEKCEVSNYEDSDVNSKGGQESQGSLNLGAERRWAYKNVLGIGFSVMFILTAFFSLQNLQSSINSDGGLGLITLTVLYFFFVSFGFLAPSALNILGTKYSLVTGFSFFVFYSFANFYPSWYTLVPASVIAGIGSALMWSAANTHLVEVAVLVSSKLDVDKSHLIGTYTGIFFCFVQVAQIPGNLVSSLILFPYNGLNQTANSSNTDSCQRSTEAVGGEFDVLYLYILCAVLSLFGIVGILLALLLVNHLGTESVFLSSSRRFEVFFKQPLISLLRVMKNHKMLLIAPVSVFNGLELSFVFGSFTALVSSCFGTYQVGFLFIPLGITSGITSLTYGRLVKYIPIICIFFFGGTINIALLIFLVLWTPVPSYPALLSFAVLWGAADGVWNTMTTSLTGILFPTQSDSAYSVLRIWLAIGFTLGFIIADLLDLHSRVWLMLVAIVIALSCIIAIEVLTRTKLSCPHHKSSYRVSRVSVDYGDSRSHPHPPIHTSPVPHVTNPCHGLRRESQV